ncbi:MAG: hypothetical protein HZA92_03995 [Verrucomicrobia bacterium]|nr:hypothetical protein [Verrucomicrobiota bacterium]
MRHLLPLLCGLFVTQLCALAQAPATVVTFESAKVTAGNALPGSNAIVTVSFKIQPGYYLHSSRSNVARVTPTSLQVGAFGATRALPPAYSSPGQKTLPGKAVTAQVYEGSLTAQVVVVIAANATFPITLPGVIAYAPVNEKTHAAGRAEQVRFNITLPRNTNAPPATAKKK